MMSTLNNHVAGNHKRLLHKMEDYSPLELARQEHGMTPSSLCQKYKHDEHPILEIRAWKKDVAQEITRLGYWEAVVNKIDRMVFCHVGDFNFAQVKSKRN